VLLQIFWNAGCQLVALNFQTLGKNVNCVIIIIIIIRRRRRRRRRRTRTR